MSKLSRQQWSELRSNFKRADDVRSGMTFTCCSCELPVRSFKQWWQKVSHEYDEWECYCSWCALCNIHLFDDFDDEKFIAIMGREGINKEFTGITGNSKE